MASAAELPAGGQSTAHPQTAPPPVDRRLSIRWADALEKRARRCRGCGEWSFAELCDWCIDVCEPQETYGFSYRNPGWAITRAGKVVHSEPTLLEAENWVTRGGADAYEQSNECSTMGRTTARQNGGAGGEFGDSPRLAGPEPDRRRHDG